jgi:3-hydroxyacyl-[acyl-carrier-protein] dehydratase
VTRHTLSIAADHPAFAGHFPGAPILPGVLLLDAALRAATKSTRAPSWEIVAAKFHGVVRPAEVLTLEHETSPNGTVQFRVLHVDRLVASGTLRPGPSGEADQERRDG